MLFTVNKSLPKHMKNIKQKLFHFLGNKSKLKINFDIFNKDNLVLIVNTSVPKHMKNIKQKLFHFLENKSKLTEDLNYINPVKWIESLQDTIERKFSNDSNQVVLKQSRRWANAITWVLMGGSAFGVCWLSIAETDEIVIALGKLEPKGGVIDVQMPIEGIADEILVKEGDYVKKGQVLINLDTEITEAKNSALINTLQINNKMSEKMGALVNEGAVSEFQYMELLAKIENIKSQIKTNSVELKYQKIISPADGIVFELAPKGPGYVARSSQPVLKIVPTNNLLAKVEIDSRQIGFVQVGKPVEISIDSFPAGDFGAVEGTIVHIGSDALPPSPAEGKGYRFPTDIKLNRQYLQIKNGKKLPLQAGMSLTANIKLRKVTYIQILLNKFGDKANSLKSI